MLDKVKAKLSEVKGPINVLILDDEVMFRKTLLYLFEGLRNMTFYEAGNNDKARQILKNHIIHLLITDIGRPSENNKELHDFLIQNSLYPLKVIFTGYSGKSLKNVQNGLRYSEFITKPLRTEDLSDLYTNVINIYKFCQQNYKNDGFYEVMRNVPDATVEDGLPSVYSWLKANKLKLHE